jgi:hypothetical protein
MNNINEDKPAEKIDYYMKDNLNINNNKKLIIIKKEDIIKENSIEESLKNSIKNSKKNSKKISTKTSNKISKRNSSEQNLLNNRTKNKNNENNNNNKHNLETENMNFSLLFNNSTLNNTPIYTVNNLGNSNTNNNNINYYNFNISEKKIQENKNFALLFNNNDNNVNNDIDTNNDYKSNGAEQNDSNSCPNCEILYKLSIFNKIPLSTLKCMVCNNVLNQKSYEFYLEKYKNNSFQNKM